MLTNNIQDLLDPQKRTLSYPNLSLEVLIAMLRKYTQAKSTGGKIRELKKKEVESLVKKLLAPLKWRIWYYLGWIANRLTCLGKSSGLSLFYKYVQIIL